MELITEPFEKALETLKEAWAECQKNTSNTFVRDSVIQRFEYTFELVHKMLRRFLPETEASKAEISEMLFNDLIRLGCKRGFLLNDLETWDNYRECISCYEVSKSMAKSRQFGGKIMARMTDKEADVLDELWTRNTPDIDTSKPGFVTRKGFTMVSLDPVTASYLQAKADISHHSLSEIINEMVRKEMSSAASAAISG